MTYSELWISGLTPSQAGRWLQALGGRPASRPLSQVRGGHPFPLPTCSNFGSSSPVCPQVPYFIPDTPAARADLAAQYTTIGRMDQGGCREPGPWGVPQLGPTLGRSLNHGVGRAMFQGPLGHSPSSPHPASGGPVSWAHGCIMRLRLSRHVAFSVCHLLSLLLWGQSLVLGSTWVFQGDLIEGSAIITSAKTFPKKATSTGSGWTCLLGGPPSFPLWGAGVFVLSQQVSLVGGDLGGEGQV